MQWNSRGYDVAKLFAHKFTYVSPVWLQIQRRSAATFTVQGTHDIDKGQQTVITIYACEPYAGFGSCQIGFLHFLAR